MIFPNRCSVSGNHLLGIQIIWQLWARGFKMNIYNKARESFPSYVRKAASHLVEGRQGGN